MFRARNLFILFFAFVFSIMLAGNLMAQGAKLAYVNDQKIKTEYKEWAKAQEQWELEKKAWDDEAAQMQQTLQDLYDEYDKQKLILSEDKKKEKEATIRSKEEALDAYTRQIYGPGGTAEKKQQQLIDPLLENVTKAIEQVALEDGYDVVFTLNSGLGYINPNFDITDRVLEVLAELE